MPRFDGLTGGPTNPYRVSMWPEQQDFFEGLPGLSLGALDEAVKRSQAAIEAKVRRECQEGMAQAYDEGLRAGEHGLRARLQDPVVNRIETAQVSLDEIRKVLEASNGRALGGARTREMLVALRRAQSLLGNAAGDLGEKAS